MRFVKAIAVVLFFTATGVVNVFGQSHNHFDPGHMTCQQVDRTEAFYESHPGQREIARAAEKHLENLVSESKSGNRDETLIIPVVFHIVHLGGEENISDEQVYSAIDVLNEDFNALNFGANSVVPAFQSIVADVNVEFRLAQIDPQGNCTNGINRVMSETTNDGDSNMKVAVPTWGRESYLNIWVCNQIGGGAAGYAFLPFSVNGFNGEGIDGIVLLHNYVGRIGTSNPTRSHALSHEVGHWANLRHPWGGSNTPGLASNCSEDDGVADTPETIGWTTCNLSGESCGSLDNVENFMDYSYCYKMFTEGQKIRMRTALNSSIAMRNQLHSQANLIQTGVLEEGVVCEADFNTDKFPQICAGESLTFEDVSFNNVTERIWSFPGGTPATSTAANPEIVYNEPGIYPVTLTASNSSSQETVVKENYVVVFSSGEESIPFSEGFESLTSLQGEQGWTDINADQSSIGWELTELAAYSGQKSLRVQGRSNSNYAIENVTSPTFDLTGVGESAVLTFKYAHARRSSATQDKLSVYISFNCGENWNWRGTWEGSELATVGNIVSGQFVPTSQSQWEEITISNIFSVFLSENFRVRFEFQSINGNNIYIDDINLFDEATVSIPESERFSELELFPVPATDFLNLNFDASGLDYANVTIRDISGRTVHQQNLGHGSTLSGDNRLSIVNLSSGVYILELNTSAGRVAKKIIID